MGLFSFGNKNKQETVRDSGHFVKDDDAAYTERARSKRASSSGEAGRRTSRGDPILPEKKRARRRLVGAIALVLAAVVALPMLLDSEPKPLATDIAIHIPDKDKAAPLPVPSEQVAPMASVDSDEEIVEPVEAPPAASPASNAPVTAPAASDPPPMRMLEQAEPPKPEPKSEPVKPKPEPKPEPVKPEPKPEPKREPTPEKKPEPAKKPVETHPKAEQVVKPASKDDAARAMAILEGKAAEPQKAQGPAPRFVVQVAALASQEKVTELQARLRGAGIASFTQKSGELIRVRIGPFSKEEAEKTRAKLGGIGLSGTMVPL
ncbi:SPOR domain-containing protein [Massilia oculi]|uniref:SPOR domain-containing protein n=1 Tax=Massilia oculi TaxID=945844 RepID=A0A2S2DMN6_9BURK|nr:SPOR domain-containing protein [Massilia oculi]AWL06571.1 SPOR domain-containing protein [Massilia oculi]